jgi:nucleoid DNA-binding protein
MTKDDLIKKIADQAGLTKDNAKKAFDAVFQIIAESLKNEEPVAISGFGTFKVTKRAATKGRNPRTGDLIDISAKTVPFFTAGKALKDAVNS